MSEKPLPAKPPATGIAAALVVSTNNEPAASSPANAKDLKFAPVMSLPLDAES